jgi:hypothetical protein
MLISQILLDQFTHGLLHLKGFASFHFDTLFTLLGRFRSSTNTITITNTSSILFQIIKWYWICKRKMPTYRSTSTKSCSFGTSRTCLNEMTRDDVITPQLLAESSPNLLSWRYLMRIHYIFPGFLWRRDLDARTTKWWRVRYHYRSGAKPPYCLRRKRVKRLLWSSCAPRNNFMR